MHGMLYSYMMISYNISRDNLSLAISITPGKKAPTISPLEGGVYGDCESLSPYVVEVVLYTCDECVALCHA